MTHDIQFVKGRYYVINIQRDGRTVYMLANGLFNPAIYGVSAVRAIFLDLNGGPLNGKSTIQREWLLRNNVAEITDEAKICELKLNGLIL